MARRRKRTDTGLIAIALNGSWHVAAGLAAATALLGFVILPAWFAAQPIISQVLSTVLKPIIWLAFGFFAVTAAIKFLLERRAAARLRRDELLARDEADHFIKQALTQAAHTQHKERLRSDALAPARQSSVATPAAWSLELLQAIEWKRFEDLCAEFYREKGIRCATTSLGADGGVDVRLYQDAEDPQRCTAIVQCKAWGERIVGVKPVRELLGVMAHEKIAKAFFMSPSRFSDEARSFAQSNSITLLDGKLFLAMLLRLPDTSRQRLLAFATEGDYTTPSCPHCGTKMLAREGAKGKFWGCANYPRCRQILQMRKAV
jgi:restriction system protein